MNQAEVEKRLTLLKKEGAPNTEFYKWGYLYAQTDVLSREMKFTRSMERAWKIGGWVGMIFLRNSPFPFLGTCFVFTIGYLYNVRVGEVKKDQPETAVSQDAEILEMKRRVATLEEQCAFSEKFYQYGYTDGQSSEELKYKTPDIKFVHTIGRLGYFGFAASVGSIVGCCIELIVVGAYWVWSACI